MPKAIRNEDRMGSSSFKPKKPCKWSPEKLLEYINKLIASSSTTILILGATETKSSLMATRKIKEVAAMILIAI